MKAALLASVAAALVLGGSALADQLPPGWTHAEVNVTVRGTSHTLIYDRGRVQSVSAAAVVLRELDGSVVTVTLSSSTRVFVDGSRAGIAAVQPGMRAQTVRVDGGAAKQLRAFSRRAR